MFGLCFAFTVPRNNDFTLNVDRIADVVELEKPKCIFLTSPNNPDGRYLNTQKRRSLVKSFMVKSEFMFFVTVSSARRIC